MRWTDTVRTVLIGAALAGTAEAQPAPPPLSLLDVPFISQSEALCGGAAAAMVLRYWGERGVAAESFAHLVDRSAAGIRTGALVADLQGRGWQAAAVEGGEGVVRGELARGRPVLALIEDRPGTFHYLVIVAWHERGVVFHDPARAPFRVMSAAEFDRRWRVAGRWMAVVLPSPERTADPDAGAGPGRLDAGTSCDALVAEGVGHAQSNDLASAERVLTSALACPGPAAPRELAGVRLLQKRWPEVTDLASAAVAADPRDSYSWRLLATGRFLQNDRGGALAAWNEVGEPRVDLVRIDGLRRTRHRTVETLIGIEAGEVLTPGRFLRARRRLAELPSASSSRLDYAPVPSGLAELRGAVSERPLFPAGRLSLAALGLSTAATRELRVASASPTGGGERIEVAWRFWERRPRVAVSVDAPAPWGGLWGVELFSERQPFTTAALRVSERAGGLIRAANWATGAVRFEVGAGVDRWRGRGTFGRLAGATRVASGGDRLDVRLQANAWLGERPFRQLRATASARSSTERRGLVGAVTGTGEISSTAAPVDTWSAGDTGHARATLTRAHPALDDGRLRAERLGRGFLGASVEGQHWWGPLGVLRAGAAVFGDLARTSRSLDGSVVGAADVGVGARLGLAGMPGIFRVDLAKGLTDGATAFSVVYCGSC